MGRLGRRMHLFVRAREKSMRWPKSPMPRGSSARIRSWTRRRLRRDTGRAMSQENVNVVRRLYEHWGRGDWNTGEFFDPAVKYARIGSDVPGDAGEWTGLREMWKAAVAYLDA